MPRDYKNGTKSLFKKHILKKRTAKPRDIKQKHLTFSGFSLLNYLQAGLFYRPFFIFRIQVNSIRSLLNSFPAASLNFKSRSEIVSPQRSSFSTSITI